MQNNSKFEDSKRGAVVEDVRTIFQRLDDATIYIPDLKPCN
jgi:hypothetical protein